MPAARGFGVGERGSPRGAERPRSGSDGAVFFVHGGRTGSFRPKHL